MSHCQATNRKVHLVNLDPAAENFEYEPTVGKWIEALQDALKPSWPCWINFIIQDIRDLITLEDVMEELDYGPNGGLIYCLEWVEKA